MNWQELARPPKRATATMYTAARFMYQSTTPEALNDCVRLLDYEDKAYFYGLVTNPLDRRPVK